MPEIRCDKCNTVMVDDSCMGVRAYKCFYCGNRHYPGYPKRIGNIVTCKYECVSSKYLKKRCGFVRLFKCVLTELIKRSTVRRKVA